MTSASRSDRQPPRAARVLILGGVVLGVLDGLDAVIFFGLRGISATRIFQGIASHLIGSGARQGGIATTALGVALHFFIAFSVVFVYHRASRRLPVLVDHPIVCGALYGLVVYAVMNYVVVPLTPGGAYRIPKWPVLLNGLLIHMTAVGQSASWSARAAARTQPGLSRRR